MYDIYRTEICPQKKSPSFSGLVTWWPRYRLAYPKELLFSMWEPQPIEQPQIPNASSKTHGSIGCENRLENPSNHIYRYFNLLFSPLLGEVIQQKVTSKTY